MEFGHLHNLRAVDFSLPADDPRSLPILGGNRRLSAHARIGLPVWTQKAWVGSLYPRGTSARDFLAAYSRQFNTVELNSTHYAIPDPATVARWREVVSPDFRFCPKILQEISHDLGRRDLPRLMQAFYTALFNLGPALGTFFLQLPPQFGPDRLGLLKRFFALAPRDLSLAVEFRHPDWFDGGRLIDLAFEALVEAGASTVISDVAGRRDVSHSSLTSPRLIVRFVGNQGHPTDAPRIGAWTSRLSRWLDQGLEELFFFVHQPDNAGSPESAEQVIEELRRKTNVPGFHELKHWDEPDQLALL